ncbi:MAG: AMP-binding protein, partial [Pseudomonadota bacterium]
VLDEGFLEALDHHGCTNLSGVPHTYKLLDEIGYREQTGGPLRFMTVAGGRLDPAVAEPYRAHLESIGAELFLMYGQTEATARIAYVPPEALEDNPGCIGIPIPGGSIDLVDEGGAVITEPDTPGELVYRGPNIMMGYASTRQDLGAGPEIDALRTGDLATRDRAGFFKVVGRLKRISKISGLRISHDALEQALAREGIEAIVTGDDRSLAALALSGPGDAHIRDVLAQASGLPPVVLRVASCEALPRLASGKPDYEAAKRLVGEANALDGDSHSTQDVYKIFEDTFAPQTVSPRDSFVSLGGDSLRYVQVLLGLEQRFGQVPDGWEQMSLRELARLNRQPSRWSRIGTDLVVRVAAIFLVVVHHATHWPIPGGAAAMMVLVGFSLARFQREPALAGEPLRLFSSLPWVLGPYFVILLGYSIHWGQIPWASVFLIGNLGFADPVDKTMLPYLYWFVEIFAQSVAIMVVLFCIPAVRRLAREKPFAFSLLLIGAGLAMRFAWAQHWDFGNRQIFTIPWNFFLFAFGWAAATASSTRERLILLAIACIAMPAAAYFGGNWIGGWVKFMIQLGVVGVLLFLPFVLLPRLLVVPVLAFAAAGYHIYLFHRFPPNMVADHIPDALPEGWVILAAVLVGIAAGFAAHEVQKGLLRNATKAKRDADWRRHEAITQKL